MWTILVVLTLAGALSALVTGVIALRAWLGFRRSHAVLGTNLAGEVARLAGRTSELEKQLAALDARAGALPVRISDLQRNLTTLRILTNALATSLRQVQKVLSPNGFKTSLAVPLARISRNLRKNHR